MASPEKGIKEVDPLKLPPGVFIDPKTGGIAGDVAADRNLVNKISGKTKKELYGLSDEHARKSAEISEKRKSELSPAGRIMFDLGTEGLHLGAQMLASAAVPGAGLALIGTRSYGNAAAEARRNGASEEQAMLYGAAMAALEIGTEKISNIAKPLSRAFGKGFSDDITETIIRKLATSDSGRRALTVIASGLGEGSEEILQGALEPAIRRAIYDKDAMSAYTDIEKRKELVANTLYEGLIGFGLGALGGGGQAILEGGIARANTKPVDFSQNGGKPLSGFPDNVAMRALFPEKNGAETDLNALANDAGNLYNNSQGSESYHGENQNNRSQSGFSGIEEIYRGLSEGSPDTAAGGAGGSTENNGQIQEQVGFPPEMEISDAVERLPSVGNNADNELGLRGHVLSPVESEALRRSGIDPENVRDVSQNTEHFTQNLKENAASQRFGACVDTDYTAADLLGSRLYTNKDGTITAGVKPDGDIFALAKRAGAPGGIDEMMLTAILNGGIKCDAYGERLVQLYARYGFIPVAKCKYSEAVIRQFNSPEIAEQKIAAFNALRERGIEPDVYAFIHNGDSVEKMGYILNEFDDLDFMRNRKGKSILDTEHRDKNNDPAPLVLFTKRINGTYYVVETVPDSSRQSIFIKTAYIENKQKQRGGGVPDVTNAPGSTSETSTAQIPQLFDSNLQQENSFVNSPSESIFNGEARAVFNQERSMDPYITEGVRDR